jgi:putative hemolysin
MPGDPFDIHLPTDTPLRRATAPVARPLLRWALQLNSFSELYRRADALRAEGAAEHRTPAAFAETALRVLNITTDPSAGDAPVPSRGPLIVAANHPHGALDGLVVLERISRVRQDVRLIANHLLARVPDVQDLCFFVDPFERDDSMRRSLAGLRAAHLWLRRGGAVIIFPAGEVAHRRTRDGIVIDSPWRSTVGRLAISTDARILPVQIAGRNSRVFYAAGRVHPVLRTVLLARELLRKRGSSVSVRIGPALLAKEVSSHGDTALTATTRVRAAVDALRFEPFERPERSAATVQTLPPASKLLTSGPFDVYCAPAAQLPHVLDEIGRLRERSFRAVGEGTGKPVDLDAFDRKYLHLFVWNRERFEVVGAYRIGRTDEIVASDGVTGLYTRSLFRYDDALIRRLPPALELGRSFVRPEYQRDHNALMLLWKGICAFVSRHPHYRVLFGAVSISARYGDRTRDMLLRFLEQNHLDPQLSKQVVALRPYAVTTTSRLEGDPRAMPVLLRQYLKLNARVLGFSVDPSFGDALDALMMIDLLRVDGRILRRYFGREEAAAFLQRHVAASHAA